MNPPNHTKFIVLCITGLAMAATLVGSYLLLKGFQSGELLAQMGSNGLSGLVGFLGGKMSSHSDKPAVNDPAVVETTTTETK